ncbi:hypothetical protein LX16_4929 [Stackebrandtia albiflava]|uniref:HEAT repeat protein n=1 Tax=Stackebrandtia albiflava TaxID=406432 RepID=A0A562UQ94_9ACTN|nr:hypothetical protein LX16_4929 [Stackebrandtia albiflava]
MSLVVYPGGRKPGNGEDILRHFGVEDGKSLGKELLRDAILNKDAIDVELALIVVNTFGFEDAHREFLVELSYADWHHSHEDVVSVLGRLRHPDTIDAIFRATQWIPRYLDYDESRALATKAIWALSYMPGTRAHNALCSLLESEDQILRNRPKLGYAIALGVASFNGVT